MRWSVSHAKVSCRSMHCVKSSVGTASTGTLLGWRHIAQVESPQVDNVSTAVGNDCSQLLSVEASNDVEDTVDVDAPILSSDIKSAQIPSGVARGGVWGVQTPPH